MRRRQLALTAVIPLLAGCGAAQGATPPTTGSASSTPSAAAAPAAERARSTGSPTAHRTASPVHLTQSPTAAASSSKAAAAGSAVGALFTDGTDNPHNCTATVVASASGSVVMTAAHCISGDAQGAVFVPGYDTGNAPYGTWTVTGAYAPAGWLSGQDENDDVAFLTVAPHGTTTLQAVTGAVTVGATPVDGERVSITAYNIGSDDQPVQCATKVRDVQQEPTIYCGGFAGGSSGSAWVTTRNGQPTAIGLIGGLHQGGCVDWTSYSPPFDGTEVALLAQVGGGGMASQDLPSPPADGC